MNAAGGGWRESGSRAWQLVLIAGAAVTSAAAIVGQLIADRLVGVSVLTYLTLPLILIAALAMVLIFFTCRVKRRRKALLALPLLCAIALEVPALLGIGRYDADITDAMPLRLLHWNVQWGGDFSTGDAWSAVEEQIVSEQPDVVVLSEAPLSEISSESLRTRLGPDWQRGSVDHIDAKIRYFARMRVLSRYPIVVEKRWGTKHGTIALARIDSPRPMSLLLVDGVSGPGDKHTLLKEVSRQVKQLVPDVICGDFNAVPRNIGFSPLYNDSYRDVSTMGASLRPTWPAWFPVVQIDHVLVHRRNSVTNSHSLFNFKIDHRGRMAILQIPPLWTVPQ